MKNNKQHINKEILDELKELGSSLLNKKEQNPFTLPSNYFEGLEKTVLDNLKEESPYKTKADYFENLADSIQNRIRTETRPQVSRFKTMHLITAIAASILLVATALFLVPKTTDVSSSSLAEAELYLEENIVDLELEEMIELELVEYSDSDQNLISHEEMESFIEENIIDLNIEELSEFL